MAILRAVGLMVTDEARKKICEIKLSAADRRAAPVAFARRDSRDEILDADIAGRFPRG